MKTKTVEHSPGKWTIYDDGDTVNSRDIVMAHMDGENWDVCAISTELPVPERKANARLIAAAPDLLEALGNLEYIVQEGIEAGWITFNKDIAPIWHDRLEYARYILNRARGEE